jgi:hypothetical protein
MYLKKVKGVIVCMYLFQDAEGSTPTAQELTLKKVKFKQGPVEKEERRALRSIDEVEGLNDKLTFLDSIL